MSRHLVRSSIMRLLAAIIFLGLSVAQALANDGYAEIGIGGLTLQSTDKISMDKEDLYVSAEEIRVEYEFSNLTAKDIEASVLFPLPDLVLREVYDSARGLINFEKHLDFKTEIDGQPFPMTLEQKAFANGRDISKEITNAGLPISGDVGAGEDFSKLVLAMTPELRQSLINAGALEKLLDDNGQEIPYPSDLYIAPQWTVKYNMARKQIFPAGKTLKVRHRYVPVTGASVMSYFPTKSDLAKMDKVDRTAIEQDMARFCYDDSFWKAYRSRVKKEKGNAGAPTMIAYVLSSGATWAGPIRDFRLVIDKGKPDALVSFCGEGVTKIAPTQFEMRKTNFEPKQDLNVMIINWQKQ